MIRKILIVIVILLAADFLFVWSISPGGPLYTWGNVRSSRFLTAFGFTKPIPDGFLFPDDPLIRIFPRTNTDSDETLRKVARECSFVDLEYMPDGSFITLTRGTAKALGSAEEMAKNLANGARPLPVRLPSSFWLLRDSTDEVARPAELSSQTLAGYSYACGRNELISRHDGQVKKYQVFVAVRKLKDPDQVFQVEIVSPGSKVNETALNQLLDCIHIE